MNESIDRAVNRVIESMYERVGEELTADDLARTAMYSKFHFSRAFRKVTGVSPGRFLSALRFQEAKRLLTGTALSVAEISNQVGYSSLGTFSTRFKKYVGVSPTEYRRRGSACPGLDQPPDSRPARPATSGTIRGEVTAALDADSGHIFVGLFPDPVPQGSPVRFTILSRPGPYELADVPEGTWYLLAQGVIRNGIHSGDDPPMGSVGRLGPIRICPTAPVSAVDVRLRPMRTVDIPVVSAPFVARPDSPPSRRVDVRLRRAT